MFRRKPTQFALFLGPFVLALTLFSWAHAYAEPLIGSVSGRVINGEPITITGMDFGSNGPTIVAFDDFEGGTNGERIKTGSGSATIGEWNGINSTSPPEYDNQFSVSGDLAMKSDFVKWYGSGISSNIDGGATDAFISYWVYMPEGHVFPGTGNPDGKNWKTSWLQGSDPYPSGDDDSIFMQGFGFGDDGGWKAADCNDCVSCSTWLSEWRGWKPFRMNSGRWYRMWAWMHGTADTTSHFNVWTLELDGYSVTEHISNDCQQFRNSGDTFDRWAIGAYGRQPAYGQSQPRFDNAYLAVGPHARARVEIGNEPVYDNCTNLAIATPTSWSNTQIIATVRQGNFKAGENAYIFVVDADGIVSAGAPITIESGSGTQVPNTPPPSLDTTPPASPFNLRFPF